MSDFSRQESIYQLMAKVQAEKIRRAFAFFRENEIEPILIKGWAIARFYPNESERFYSDTDLVVDPNQFEKASKLIASQLKTPLAIDLHRGLTLLDEISFEDLFDNSRLVELQNAKIRILRPEDHLRVLAVHWLRDGGMNKQRLWDIHYAIKNRSSDFDWNRCLGIVSEKRRKWIVAAIAVAHRFTNLNVDDTPIGEEVKNPDLIPGWMLRTLEKEWNDSVKIVPLEAAMNEPKEFWRQLKKRFPPNPLVASIYADAPLNNFPRFPFQIINIFQRFAPSVRRTTSYLSAKIKRRTAI